MSTTYTPARAAALSGFTLDTLRYYEREGIMPAVARTAGGHRLYSEADISTLGFLRCLRDTGMPIELLKRYGQLCRDDDTLAERLDLLREHAAGVQQQIDELLEQQRRLDEKIGWYRGELDRRAGTA
ncbi:MerR family transcriptional regulator [Agromyces intestinalis]|uniref:MerR family transcriptional regulator n=1 Tax=Agromyces intestinalis TaxID=2592652 RepID=A0A5C1YE25_9MICO|nr:MerR family transcriptional regulator [Agromyces intestinalis]QEO13257.1 MerR family transcriptional regulator [Agromyces intestinalis]